MKISFCSAKIIPLRENSKKNAKFDDENKPLKPSKNEVIPYGNMYLYLNQKNNFAKKSSINPLENYDTAYNYFEKNLNSNKPVLGNTENLGKNLSNDKIRRNLCQYFAERAEKELDEIKITDFNDKEQIAKIQGLNQVKNYFNDFLGVWPEESKSLQSNQPVRKVAFAGKLTRDDEKYCKNVVHAVAGACAATSGALGEGGALGADTAILRTIQSGMFLYLQQHLKVPFIASSEYTFKEMCTGAVLGVEGAKIITDWLGIGAHAASVATGTSVVTGGTSNAAITGSVRAVNGTLSFLITEKMGRGYIRRVENNQMTFKHQTVELGTYMLGKGLLTGTNPFETILDTSVMDACDPDEIKNAFDSIDNQTKSIFGTFMNILQDNYAGKLATYSVLEVGQNLILSKDKSPEHLKKVAKESFKHAFLRATVYEICDLAVDETITKNAEETITDMQENLEKYPDVYKVFVNAEHEFIENLNIDSLDDKDFTRQFKNKTFVYNSSALVDGYIEEFSDTWRNRKNKIQAQKLLILKNGINEENNKRKEINNQIDPNEKAELETAVKDLSKELKITKDFLTEKDDYGYGRIAGYEKEKAILTEKFILPASLERERASANIPNAILFYGPTGTGKSTLTQSLAEQSNCRNDKLKTIYSEEKIIDKFLDKVKIAEDIYKESGKRTVLLIDEIDGLNQKQKVLAVLSEFIENCSKQNHISLFLTTNKPQDVNEKLLQNALKIPIGPSNKTDRKEIISHYLKNKVSENFDYDKLSEEIEKLQSTNSYSNTQLENTCYNCINQISKENRLINTQDMLKCVKEIIPEISKKDLNDFKDDCTFFAKEVKQ